MVKKLKIKMLLFSSFFLFLFSTNLFSDGSFFSSFGYSPGITDYYRLDPDPHTHSYKYVRLGLDLYNSYLSDKNIGFALDLHWGIIYKMKMENNQAGIVTENWTGTISQLNITPYFLYAPLRNELMILVLGIGPSTTMNLYTSDYGNDTNEFYWGISANIHFNYFIDDRFFIDVGLRFTADFIGLWDSETITSIFQTQYYPVFGMGIKL